MELLLNDPNSRAPVSMKFSGISYFFPIGSAVFPIDFAGMNKGHGLLGVSERRIPVPKQVVVSRGVIVMCNVQKSGIALSWTCRL